MELNHFSHKEHPLILKELQDDDSDEVVCYLCKEPVSGSTYCCTKCKFFLHEFCTELPSEITHPMHPTHPQHPLKIFSESPSLLGRHRCSICYTYRNSFTYHCSKCEFAVDVLCAQLEGTYKQTSLEGTYKHTSHQHPLKLQLRSAWFKCDACGVEENNQSYYCTVCSFWIHKSCGSLPSSWSCKDHSHPLSLAYGLPEQYRHYNLNCDICRDHLRPDYWVYYCGPCRYFVHLKCMTSESQEDEAVEASRNDVINLPVENVSSLLIRHFSEQNSLPQIELQTEINHFSHEHSLILSNIQDDYSEMYQDDQETVCNGCTEPISDSCYSCGECKYFIHIDCAQLPEEVSHADHPEHKLSLHYCQEFYHLITCSICEWSSNGFFYECNECDFLLDIRCALLPTTIKHEAHNHLLVRRESSRKLCNACSSYHGFVAFGCEQCQYHLASECAMLPRITRHRWDEHPLILSFPPFYDHPDEFICDICEYEIHPKFWLYRCSKCDNSFHTYCVPRLGRFRYVKFGGTLQSDYHPHSLTFVRKATYMSSCQNCGEDLSRRMAFECEPCMFNLCRPCACNDSSNDEPNLEEHREIVVYRLPTMMDSFMSSDKTPLRPPPSSVDPTKGVPVPVLAPVTSLPMLNMETMQQRLQMLIQGTSESWTYAIFWQYSVADYMSPGILGWGDGYYQGHGDEAKRETAWPFVASTSEKEHRKRVLIELNSLISGTEESADDAVDEEVTDTEWFFLISMTQSFVNGSGLPGQAFYSSSPVWIAGGDRLATSHCIRARKFPGFGLQTVVCIPSANGVVELGSTELIFESADLINKVRDLLTQNSNMDIK